MSNSGEEVRRSRGRPRSSPEGRSSTLTMTISPQTRAYLESAASRMGRSLSQTAEHEIERGKLLAELGSCGPLVADELLHMLRAATAVIATVGDPTLTKLARDELRKRWQVIAARALPDLTYPLPSESAAVAAISSMRFAAIDAAGELATAAPNDETVRDVVGRIASGEIHPGLPSWDQARRELEMAAEIDRGHVGEVMSGLLGIARAAEAMVARAEREIHERS
jgi:hypothetical protein